jgi:putative ABC transport system permease protein
MRSHRVPIARRNLMSERRRATLAFGGVGAALLLVLLLQGVFAGAMQQVTSYVRTSRADVIVSQTGVRTMHMSSSALPSDTAARIRTLPRVSWAEGIQFAMVAIGSERGRQLSYVIGYDTRTGRAGPATLVEGRSPGPGEVVLDRLGARALSVGVGGRVTVFGRSFAVSGLSNGGTSITNSIAFMPAADFTKARGTALAYVMVGAAGTTTNAAALGHTIESALPVTAQTRAEFVHSESRLVTDMSADVLRIFTVIGLGIALAIISLLLYSVTLARLREFGVLKALGATPTRVIGVVIAQVGWIVAISVAVAVALTYGVGAAISNAAPTVEVVVRMNDVAHLAVYALIVASIGALVPLRRVLRVDPASAFRRVS